MDTAAQLHPRTPRRTSSPSTPRLLAAPWRTADRLTAAISLAAAQSAFLLFFSQPLFARYALPIYGGGASVWTASLVFSQVALLAGYAYAHLSRTLPLRTQVMLHLGLMWSLLGAPPIALSPDLVPGEPVTLDFLRTAALRLGPQIVLLSGTGVLLQRWLSARSARPDSSYALYAAGSAGSLVGLLAFPFLLEPTLSLRAQSVLWTILYLVLTLLVTLCARPLLRRAPATPGTPSSTVNARRPAAATTVPRAGARRALAWIALAAAPCALMVSLTTVLTTDVAAVPLVWVAPLAVYLLTYTLAFAPGNRVAVPAAGAAALTLPAIVAVAGRLTNPLGLLLTVHLTALFVLALACHRRLASMRPAAAHGSAFYLCVAAGGALGGVAAGLAAPHLLDSVVEYPVSLVAAWLLGHFSLRPTPRRVRVLDVTVPLAAGAMTAALMARAGDGWAITGVVGAGILLAPAATACLLAAGRPLRFGLTATALLAAALLAPGAGTTLHTERTPFGLHRVRLVEGDLPTDRYHLLLHGTTMHGIQRRGGIAETEPLSYYHRQSGIADVFAARRRAGAASGGVAVAGLGAGSLACYGGPGERWTFFEIDPAVIRIARDPRLFT